MMDTADLYSHNFLIEKRAFDLYCGADLLIVTSGEMEC
jgi:hypothetical protein